MLNELIILYMHMYYMVNDSILFRHAWSWRGFTNLHASSFTQGRSSSHKYLEKITSDNRYLFIYFDDKHAYISWFVPAGRSFLDRSASHYISRLSRLYRSRHVVRLHAELLAIFFLSMCSIGDRAGRTEAFWSWSCVAHWFCMWIWNCVLTQLADPFYVDVEEHI